MGPKKLKADVRENYFTVIIGMQSNLIECTPVNAVRFSGPPRLFSIARHCDDVLLSIHTGESVMENASWSCITNSLEGSSFWRCNFDAFLAQYTLPCCCPLPDTAYTFSKGKFSFANLVSTRSSASTHIRTGPVMRPLTASR